MTDETKTTPITIDGHMIGFVRVYVPDGWGTPEFEKQFARPDNTAGYLQRIREQYDPEGKA